MGYPQGLLTTGETVELDQHPHWSALALGVFWPGVILVAGVVSLLAWGKGNWVYAEMGIVAVGIAWTGGRILTFYTTDFVVSSMRIILRRGVLTHKSQEILLDRITNTSVRRSLVERILGNGTLVVESAGRDGQTTFVDIAQVSQVQRLILGLIESRARGPIRDIDLAGQLERLSLLHTQGHLSDEEFSRAKNALWSGNNGAS